MREDVALLPVCCVFACFCPLNAADSPVRLLLMRVCVSAVQPRIMFLTTGNGFITFPVVQNEMLERPTCSDL